MGYGTFRNDALSGSKPSPSAIPGAVQGGKVRIFAESFDLSKASVDKNTGTTNFCFRKPKGHAVSRIVVESNVSLTTTQLAFGIAGTPAKYGAAKVYGTTPDVEITWIVAGNALAISETEEDIIMTISAANLPGAGIVNVKMQTFSKG